MLEPYYQRGDVALYCGDARDVLPHIGARVLVTDPPYPNNAGHFDADVDAAREVLAAFAGGEAVVFWSELERPPVRLPLVAVHVWHRTNMNGRPYEPAYHFHADGRKRRSEVLQAGAIVPGPCAQIVRQPLTGHPTQKNEAVMERLVAKTAGAICDPFAGSGTTGVAALRQRRACVLIEREERWCEIAALRLSAEPEAMFDAPVPEQLDAFAA